MYFELLTLNVICFKLNRWLIMYVTGFVVVWFSFEYLFQAIEDYNMVLLLASSNGWYDSSCTEGHLTLCALINCSLINLQHSDYNSALCGLLSAVALSPHDKTIYQTLGICYHKLVSRFCVFILFIFIFHYYFKLEQSTDGH